MLPLPKKRGAVAPKGFTRRYGNTIAARIGVVGRDGLDACVYQGTTAPVNKAPPPVTTSRGRCRARNMRPPAASAARECGERIPAGEAPEPSRNAADTAPHRPTNRRRADSRREAAADRRTGG